MPVINTILCLALVIHGSTCILAFAKNCTCDDVNGFKLFMDNQIEEVNKTCEKQYKDLENKIQEQSK
jgi:hypothetical protein